MKAYCLNKISQTALDTLKKPDGVVESLDNADSILVRSQAMHEMVLDSHILAVARAGAGVNNIPLAKYAEQGVVVFNTPGANANAVKELVLCGMLMASRDVLGGNRYIEENKKDENIAKAAEKAKAAFAGNEIKGHTLAVIGLGVIGVLVANAAIDLGMKVIGYDPYLTINNAMKLAKEIQYTEKLEDAVKTADYITVHVPLMDSTKHMINKDIFKRMKDNSVLLNFSRDTLVDDEDLKTALESGRIRKYVTDFANPAVVQFKNVICFPHLGASTQEAEDNCAVMAIAQVKDYLENGNITHSVNYPDLNAGTKQAESRICILHRNIPGMIANFSSDISANGGNIVTLVNRSKGEYAYSIIDVDGTIDIKPIEKVEGVLRVRVI